MKKSIRNFKGILPRYSEGNMPIGNSEVASNVDIFDGKLKGVAEDNRYEQSPIGGPGPLLHVYKDRFYSGDGYATNHQKDGQKIMIYTDPGNPMKIRVDDDVDNLGLDRPGNFLPQTWVSGTSLLTPGEYQYVIVWERRMNGISYIDISEPSDIFNYTQVPAVGTGYPVLWRPAVPTNSFVTHWRLYRTTSDGSVFYYVDTVPIATLGWADNTPDDDIITNEILPSYYTSYASTQSGVNIFWSAPVVEFDGIASSNFQTIIFGWKDDVFYMSEPGQPQAWPILYSQSVGSKIINIIVMESYAAILTEDAGTLRIDYKDPLLMTAQKTRGIFPCIAPRAWAETPFGLCYLSNFGIAVFNGSETKIAFRYGFDEAPLVSEKSFFAVQNDKLILFGSGSYSVVYDTRNLSKPFFYTFSGIDPDGDYENYIACFMDNKSGKLYALIEETNKIISLFEENTTHSRKEFDWVSGKIEFPKRIFNKIKRVILKGKGRVEIFVFMNNDPFNYDTFIASKEIDMDAESIYDRQLLMPSGTKGEYFQFKIKAINYDLTTVGTVCPVVEELIYEVF